MGREVGAQDNCLGSQCMLEFGGNYQHFCSKYTEISTWQIYLFDWMLAPTVMSVLFNYTCTAHNCLQCYHHSQSLLYMFRMVVDF